MNGTTTAIIYIPAGLVGDERAANDCLAHLQRRQYGLFALLRDLDLVDWALEDGRASRIVVDRREHVPDGFPVPVEVVGEITRDLVSEAGPITRPRPPRLDLRKLLIALMVATVGAALLWAGLQEAELGAVVAPLYVLVGLVLAAWIPMAGAGINAAWAADVNAALAWAGAWAYRDGYSDGFVDCAAMEDR